MNVLFAIGFILAAVTEEIVTPKPGVPELLKFNDGTPVKTVADWTKRRAELKEVLQREVYGFRPVERPENLKFELLGDPKPMMGGLAVRKIVRASWTGPFRDWSFDFLVFEPVAVKKPAPSFVFICNRDRSNIDPERRERSGFWPAEEIVTRGYAAITFHYEGIAPDDCKAPFSKGVYACWAKDGVRGADTWGALSAWAWGASRVLDWIETEPALNAKRVAVVGHSRGGKTALLAGALDERFAMACANDSGCGGVKLNRFSTPGSETIAAITRNFPHWFSPAYPKWAGRDAETPFEQHELVALMAPRLCAVADATKDDWAGQLGEWYSCSLASPAWELFGKKGLEPSTRPPIVSGAPIAGTCLQEGSISYHCRSGGHNLTPVDWDRYMDFADRHGWRD